MKFNISVHQNPSSQFSPDIFEKLVFGKTHTDHMAVVDFDGEQWINPRIVPFEDLKFSPFNSALHYGQSIFEGMKAFRQNNDDIVGFRATDNIKRFNISAERMCMSQIPEELLFSLIQKMVETDQQWVPNSAIGSLYLRPFMFATDAYLGVKASQTYTCVVVAAPVGSYYSGEVSVKVEQHYSRACAGGVGFAKTSGNYAASLYPAKLANQEGFNQILWTDAETHTKIEEAGTMNIVAVIDEALVFIPESDSVLAGITRRSLLTLAQDLGMKFEERELTVSELVESQKSGKLTELFGCGTAAVVTPISSFGIDGEVYKISQETSFAEKLKSVLEAIRSGEKEDSHGWITRYV